MTLDGLTPPLLVVAGSMLLVGLQAASRRWMGRRNVASQLVVLVLIVCLTSSLELLMGRPLTYQNGPVRLWWGTVASDQNSQQFSDPYSFTHVVHGAAFYGLTRAALPLAPVPLRLVVATSLESAWEVYENTDTVINRYRTETVSLGYYGDSVTNSLGDIVMCLLGFVLAWRFPTRVTLAWVVAIEVALLFWIRDNLTLNVIMLIHPFEAVRAWQLGA